MHQDGLGPATLRQLHNQLGIRSPKELVDAVQTGKLEGLKGYGAKKIANIKRSLQIDQIKKRVPYADAAKIAEKIVSGLKKIKEIDDIFIAGSLRRKKETIGDIDILCTTSVSPRKKVIEKIKTLPFIQRISEAGTTRMHLELHDSPLEVDIRIVTPDQLGAALLYFTGSKEHNIQLRTMAKQKGWKINEYGVFDERTGKRIAGKTENEIYQLMGYPFIPPERRLGKNEWILAINH
jgi:DNA polymerase (family 10)